jgi:hypothetical protein
MPSRTHTSDEDVFPTDVVQTALVSQGGWGKVTITRIERYLDYIDNWKLISDFLNSYE